MVHLEFYLEFYLHCTQCVLSFIVSAVLFCMLQEENSFGMRYFKTVSSCYNDAENKLQFFLSKYNFFLSSVLLSMS